MCIFNKTNRAFGGIYHLGSDGHIVMIMLKKNHKWWKKVIMSANFIPDESNDSVKRPWTNHEKCSPGAAARGLNVNSSRLSSEDNSAQLSILMRIGLTKYPSSWHPITRSRGPQRKRARRALQEVHVKRAIKVSPAPAARRAERACDCHRLLFLSMMLALHRRPPPSLSQADWPRSEVTADAVSTSWVSFRSSAGIHLRYKRKPRVSAEPRRQTKPDNFLLLLVWLAYCGCWEAEVHGFVTGVCVDVCVYVGWGVKCVIYCDWFGLELTYLWKKTHQKQTLHYMAGDFCEGSARLNTQLFFYSTRKVLLFNSERKAQAVI